MNRVAQTLLGARSDFNVDDLRPSRHWSRPPLGVHYVVSQLITTAPLVLSDGLAIVTTLVVGSLLGFSLPSLSASVCLVVAMWSVYASQGLYPAIGLHPVIELQRCSVASMTALAIVGFYFMASGATLPEVLALIAVFGPTALLVVPGFRSAARRIAARSDRWTQPVIIFGSGKRSAELYRTLAANRRSGFRPLGFVDEIEAHWVDTDMHPDWYLGTPREAVDIAVRDSVYWAVVGESVDRSREHRRTFDLFASAIPHRLYSPGISPRVVNTSVQTRSAGGVSMIYECDWLALPGPRAIKHLSDIGISLAVALMALPLMLLIGLLIKMTSPGPVVYAHERLGRNGKPFKALKFRTMRVDAAEVLERYLVEHPHLRAEWEAKQKLTNDPRVTRLGSMLRKTSLDELPQVFNVLKGDMSLVGPRPIVDDEIERYDEAYESYCRVLPGIAGLWQVSGRNNTTYEERINYDVEYVQNWSPWLDLYLLARTVKVVLTRDGAY